MPARRTHDRGEIAVATVPFAGAHGSPLRLVPRMSEAEISVPDDLEEQLDDLAEELRDPDRGDRTIEDQGVEGSIVGEDEGDESDDRDE